MSIATAPQIHSKTTDEVRNIATSFVGKLDVGELLTGSPNIEEITTTALTFANQAVNVAALTINSKTVAIGMAVQFKVSGGVAGISYRIRVTVNTDATPAQTLVAIVRLEVEANT